MQERRRQTAAAPASGTRYVFAGTHTRDEESAGTKVCPRCGELLFADMDVCYGCLYDFTRDEQGRSLNVRGSYAERMRDAGHVSQEDPSATVPHRDPLEGIELDEIDEEPDFSTLDFTQKEMPVVPRHRKPTAAAADSTLDFASIGGAGPTSPEEPLCLIVRSSDLQLSVPLRAEGLSIGRGEANDIILSSRLVSRQHLRLMPQAGAVIVENCGATNPATIDGRALEGTACLSPGEMVVVCGTEFEIASVR